MIFFHYFAYGSNMLPARLLDRCRSATLVGTGSAMNFGLEFSKVSKDGSGKATLVGVAGSNVPGVIFEIDVTDQEALDQHEGLGFGYRRDDAFTVDVPALGTSIQTSTYLATAGDNRLKPFDWYLATVIAGALHHGMDEAHIAGLRSTAFVEDTRTDRKTRIAAIKAMRDHGIEDFRMLLGV